MGVSWQEMLITLLVFLLLFGAKRMPDISILIRNIIKECQNILKDLNSQTTSDKKTDTGQEKSGENHSE